MRRRQPSARPLRFRLGTLLVVLGAILLAVPVGIAVRDELSARRLAADAPPPSDPAAASPAPEAPADQPAPDAAEAAYRIVIPRIGVDYPVGEGVDNPVLAEGPGHYPETVLPGEVGNSVLAGHRTVRGQPAFFYRLDELEEGDEIRIAYPDRILTFAVEEVFLTDPYDLSVMDPTEYAALTLTTCHPPGSDEFRLIVRASLVEERPR